jgi:hypothetical protein
MITRIVSSRSFYSEAPLRLAQSYEDIGAQDKEAAEEVGPQNPEDGKGRMGRDTPSRRVLHGVAQTAPSVSLLPSA